MVRVVTDCVKGDKAKESDNEIEIKSEEVFLQREQAITRIGERVLVLKTVPTIFKDTIKLLCILN